MKKAKKQDNQKSESVDSRLRSAIREGRYSPGQRLIEIDLQQQLDASQRQVRDALRQLEGEGLITIEKNRGASVRKITHREVECILDVLDALSLLAVRQACEKVQEKESRKNLEKSLRATERFHSQAAGDRQIHKFLDENVRFWDSIATVVDNPVLWDIRERLETMLFRLQVQGMTFNSDPEKWIAHHEDILNAILEQNSRKAERLVLKSSDDIRGVILELGEGVFN